MRPLALSSEQFKAVKSILTHCWSNVVHHQFPHAESSFSTSISRRTEHPKGKTSFTKHALQLHQIAFPEERKWGNEALYKLLWVLLSNSSMRSLCYFAVSALHVFIWPSVKSVSGIMVLCILLLWSITFFVRHRWYVPLQQKMQSCSLSIIPGLPWPNASFMKWVSCRNSYSSNASTPMSIGEITQRKKKVFFRQVWPSPCTSTEQCWDDL